MMLSRISAGRFLPVLATSVVLASACADSPSTPNWFKAGDSASSAWSPYGRVAKVEVVIDSATLAPNHESKAVARALSSTGAVITGRTFTWTSTNNGIATIPKNEGRVIAVQPGTVTIRATVDGVTGGAPVTVTTKSSTPTPTTNTLAIVTQPGGAVSGKALTTQPVVRVVNSSGALVSTATGTVTAAIASGSGTLSGTATAKIANGLATFSNLTITGSGSVALRFSATGLTAVTSSAFTVAAGTTTPTPAVATRLTVTTQPSASAVSGAALAQQPTVQLRASDNSAVAKSGVVVTAAIASGGGTLGGTATATTNANGLATFTNLSISGTAGSRTLTFSSPNLTSATSNAISITTSTATTPPPTTIPVGSGEPTYNSSSHTMVLQDAFDNYNSFSDAVGGGWRCSNESTSNDVSTNSAGACQIIPGYSGKAIRLVYDGRANSDGQEGHAWSHTLADAAAGTQGKAIYVSYYFRITPGGGIQLDASPSNRVQVKWLMLWGSNDRAQFSTAYSYCTNGLPQTMWNFYARGAGAGTCQGGQVRAPFAKDGAGQWHRATHRYVTQSAPGARDGSAQMWIDGTLILSVAKGYCGVAVPQNAGTNSQNWCENADLDSFYTNDAVRKMTLGSVSTSSLWAFTLDWDNMTIWRDR